MVATILTIFLSKNGILNSTFFVLDSTIWLDSTLKIDPASRPKTTKTTKSLPARDSPYKLLYNGWYMSPSNMPLLVGDLSPRGSLGSHKSPPKPAHGRFIRFRAVHSTVCLTPTRTQTTLRQTSAAIAHIYAVRAMRHNNSLNMNEKFHYILPISKKSPIGS